VADAGELTVGVDLGGTKIQTAAVRGGEILGSARLPTPQSGLAADVIEAIAQTIRTSLEKAGADQKGLAGIGIGTPGKVDAEAGTVSLAANVPGFSGTVPLGPLVSQAIGGVGVRVENDVHVGVLGEHRAGAGRPYREMLGVWVGTGVGGGLVLGGKLHEGRGAAGEIGHMVVRPDGRPCSCGRRGCLEAYAGRASMERRARRLHEHGHKTILFEIMEHRGAGRLTSGVYASALKRGDKMAKELIADAVQALGIALASVQNLLDLEAIVIGGGLGDRLGEPFVKRIREHMTPHLFVDDHPPAVIPTELGDLSGAVGGAILAGTPLSK
jgi:glucokinase